MPAGFCQFVKYFATCHRKIENQILTKYFAKRSAVFHNVVHQCEIFLPVLCIYIRKKQQICKASSTISFEKSSKVEKCTYLIVSQGNTKVTLEIIRFYFNVHHSSLMPFVSVFFLVFFNANLFFVSNLYSKRC